MEPNPNSQPTRRLRKNNKTHPLSLAVTKAEYVEGYTIRVSFNDGTEQVIDFTRPFKRLKGYYAQYREPEAFQSFTIDMGNLVWGENWDVEFPIWSLYTGSVARRYTT